jgi:hypothetical protein
MKKIMIAALGLSLLSGSALVFAQNTTNPDTTTTKKHKTKHNKKSKTASDTTATK